MQEKKSTMAKLLELQTSSIDIGMEDTANRLSQFR